jgi:hypothetical protein
VAVRLARGRGRRACGRGRRSRRPWGGGLCRSARGWRRGGGRRSRRGCRRARGRSSARRRRSVALTLDDWAETLNGSQASSETRSGEVTTGEPHHLARAASANRAAEQTGRHHLVATELLETPGALLTRTHLRELGLERRAVDAVFRALPVVALPGYSRPMIRADEYVELVERSTYDGDRVRPSAALTSRRVHAA